MANRAYEYRFCPTSGQVELLARTFGCVRFAYNSVLRWRTDAFFQRQERVGSVPASDRLTAIKEQPELAFLNEVSCVPLQQFLRHQQTAFKHFFEGRAFKSEFVRQLEYKSGWAGREVVGIDRWSPSVKRCSCRGHAVASVPLPVRSWACPACGTAHDRDANAAVNIKAAGLAVSAPGENVSGIGQIPLSCSR